MRKTLTYLYDEDEESQLRAIRITVGDLTIRKMGEHMRLVAATTEKWRIECGRPAEGSPDDTTPPTQEQTIIYNAYMQWCECFAATTKIVIIRAKALVGELDIEQTDTWPWEESSLAELGLDKPEGALDLPAQLLTAWKRAADLANPGIFGPALPKTAKKTTGLITMT